MFIRLKSILYSQLTQGVRPHEIALTCSFAFVIGTFPFFGTTTLLCFLVGVSFRLNQPLLHTLNYVLTPVHLIGIPIYIRLGEMILNKPSLSIHPLEMFEILKSDWHRFLTDYGAAILHAILAWTLIAPALGILVYFFIKPIAQKISDRRIARKL